METEKMLPPEVTVEDYQMFLFLIISVAKSARAKCLCYGHLCSDCNNARELLEIVGVKVNFMGTLSK